MRTRLVLGALFWAFATTASGQTPLAPASAPQIVSVPHKLTPPIWRELSPVQQVSLAPLKKTWDGLAEGHRRKWIAVAQSYPKLEAPEQEKMHGRMAQWAALSPKDREIARLNFAETKKIAPKERVADWEAYQSLTPEERSQLARKAQNKPAGAAIAVKPVPSEKLAVVPVTRHSPELVRERESAKQAINRNTLLPIIPRALPASSAAPVTTPPAN